jgi:hypothetical protein
LRGSCVAVAESGFGLVRCLLAAGHRGHHKTVIDLMGSDESWWEWDAGSVLD